MSLESANVSYYEFLFFPLLILKTVNAVTVMVQTHGGFFRQNDSRISIFLQTLNTRLPFKLGSVWPQTLPKRVSDDPRHFIFRRQKKTNRQISWTEKFRRFFFFDVGK